MGWEKGSSVVLHPLHIRIRLEVTLQLQLQASFQCTEGALGGGRGYSTFRAP